MRADAQTVLRALYDAWRCQDLEQVASYLHEEFSHTVLLPTSVHPLGGTRVGKATVVERLGTVVRDFDFVTFDTSRLMFDGNRAAVEIPVLYRHRPTGIHLESVIANFWTFEGGRPLRLKEYHDVSRIRTFSQALAAQLAGG